MIRAVKEWIKRRWPPLRLRTILFMTLFFVAALPGASAIFLRVYENTLVRQTEAELVAQGAALAAAAQLAWPGAREPAMPDPSRFRPEPPRIDLNDTPILPARPAPPPAAGPPVPEAVAAARRLMPVIARTRQTTLAAILLIDGNGQVLNGSDAGHSYAGLAEVRAALAGRPDTVLRRNLGYRQVYLFEWLSRAAAIRVHHARPIVIDGRVVGVLLLSRSARALFRGIYEDRAKIIVGALAILFVLIVLSGVLSRGIARPIEALGIATRAVAAGGGGVPEPPRTAAVEIQGLYRDFAAMAEAIDHRSRYLRDFAHAMSHEFKTPLAGIRGAIELLRDHAEEMSTGERARFLANADADAERLTSLVTRLLELARADMTQAPAHARADIGAVVAAVADAHRSDTLDIAVAGTAPCAAVPASTVEAALTTLIENSRQAGATAIGIRAEEGDDRIMLHVSDNGPGIAEADRERIFEPFFTTRRADGGTGLGLPIVRSLLAAAGAGIELAPGRGGARFTLTLPRA